VKHESKRAPKLFGFVHNPETDPLPLLDLASDLLASMKSGARDLVISVDGTSCLDACRYICSQLNVAASFKKVLIESSGGRVEEFI
jgi:alcohol dehydrogenase class IV